MLKINATAVIEDWEIGQNIIQIQNLSDKKVAFQISVNREDTIFHCSDVGKTILSEIESNSTFKLTAVALIFNI
jgi:hypothetical protein